MVRYDKARFGAIVVARDIGISLRQLYYWVHVLHAVRPKSQRHGKRTFQYFTTEDVRVLRTVKRLMDQGYTLRAAVRKSKSRS